MAFHYTRFGVFGLALQPYADLHGYVPQAGDDASMFDYPDDDVQDWLDHVADAEAATERAQNRLTMWQDHA